MIQSVPIILDIKQKARQSYLCTCTLFAVVLSNLLVELYSIIWGKNVDVHFFKKMQTGVSLIAVSASSAPLLKQLTVAAVLSLSWIIRSFDIWWFTSFWCEG